MHTITVVNLNYICLQQYSTYLRVLRLRVQLRLRNYVDVHNYWVNVMFENPIQNGRELKGFNWINSVWKALEKDFSVVKSFNSICILKLIVVTITYNELRGDYGIKAEHQCSGNRFLIIKILKHKKGQTIFIPELSLSMLKQGFMKVSYLYWKVIFWLCKATRSS